MTIFLRWITEKVRISRIFFIKLDFFFLKNWRFKLTFMWNSPNRKKPLFWSIRKKINQFGKKPFVDRDRKRDKWWSQIFLAEKRQNTRFSSNETEWQSQIWSIKNKRQPCKNVKNNIVWWSQQMCVSNAIASFAPNETKISEMI